MEHILKKWKQALRDQQARNIKQFRYYTREFPNDNLSNFYEGRISSTRNTLFIFDYIIQEEKYGNA